MKRIEICGNIASGKTTLCQNLVSKGFVAVFEKFQENPFIEKFYEAPFQFSFETEVTFLLLHYHSIKLHLKQNHTAYDFSLFQDIAYADVNLDGDRHKLFLEMAQELQNEISFPSQIVHLICPEHVLINRIRKRNREVESTITIGYLKQLAKAIQFRLKEVQNKFSIILIDSNVINFTKEIEYMKEFDSFRII